MYSCESINEIQNQIVNLMKLSGLLMENYNLKALEDCSLEGRRGAVKLIKKYSIEFELTSDERDTAIQLLDKFLMAFTTQNVQSLYNLMDDPKIVHLVVICSLLLSSKFFDSQSQLMTDDFADCFDSQDIQIFEEIMLETVGYLFYPQCTPSSFIYHLLNLYQQSLDISQVKVTSDFFVSIFMEEPEYFLFAPSTIAIAAIMMSFEECGINYKDNNWFSYVPNECLTNNPYFQHLGPTCSERLLDIHSCLDSLDRVSKKYHIISPTSVTEEFEEQPNMITTGFDQGGNPRSFIPISN